MTHDEMVGLLSVAAKVDHRIVFDQDTVDLWQVATSGLTYHEGREALAWFARHESRWPCNPARLMAAHRELHASDDQREPDGACPWWRKCSCTHTACDRGWVEDGRRCPTCNVARELISATRKAYL